MILFIFFKRSKTTQISPVKLIPRLSDIKKDNQVVFIGPNKEAPVVTIKSLKTDIKFENTEEINFPIKFNSLLQAVPSLLTFKESAGKQLYEVVINGKLTRAADGIGYRGFSQGPDGKIIEHTRLFEEGKLQNIINATAIWQLASVIVAQKHLADISAKLDEIKNGIRDILQFLDNERKAKVDSIIDYLR